MENGTYHKGKPRLVANIKSKTNDVIKVLPIDVIAMNF